MHAQDEERPKFDWINYVTAAGDSSGSRREKNTHVYCVGHQLKYLFHLEAMDFRTYT